MSYYTVAHILQKGNIYGDIKDVNPQDLNDEVHKIVVFYFYLYFIKFKKDLDMILKKFLVALILLYLDLHTSYHMRHSFNAWLVYKI